MPDTTTFLPTIAPAEIRPAWLEQHHEEAIDPGMPIVDAHHHLSSRFWGSYLELDILSDVASGHTVAATIIVECGFAYRDSGPAEMQPRRRDRGCGLRWT